MQHNAAFHQGLHCLLGLKQSSGTEIHHNLENATGDLLNYTIGSQYVWDDPSEYKRLIIHCLERTIDVPKRDICTSHFSRFSN